MSQSRRMRGAGEMERRGRNSLLDLLSGASLGGEEDGHGRDEGEKLEVHGRLMVEIR